MRIVEATPHSLIGERLAGRPRGPAAPLTGAPGLADEAQLELGLGALGHRGDREGGIVPKARILAVDDQRYFRELIEEFLAAEGFEVQTASSGEEALHLLERSAFDIVLTDLVMPGMDGSELVHRVKSRNPEQDIVVVTGVVDVKTAVDAMKLGASDYLLKPFDRRALALCLEGILQKRRLQSEHARLLAENIEFMGERAPVRARARAVRLRSRSSRSPSASSRASASRRRRRAACSGSLSEDGALRAGRRARARAPRRRAGDSSSSAQLPAELRDERTGSLLAPADPERAGAAPALFVPLRREGSLIGVARLTDRLEGDAFDDVDRVCAQKFARHAEVALANALRFGALEKRSLEDPVTGAYTSQYFQDVVRNEIEKANRFGRSFALVELDLGTARRAAPRGRRGGRPDAAHGRRRGARAAAARHRPARRGRRAPLPRAALRGGRARRRGAQAPRAAGARRERALHAPRRRTRGPTRSSAPPSTRATAPASRRCCACSTSASTRSGAAPCAASASSA